MYHLSSTLYIGTGAAFPPKARRNIPYHYFLHPDWPLQGDAVNFLVTRYNIIRFDSLLWYEKGQNTATKKLLAIIMKVEVFLACVLHMFVILNGSENLLFFFSIRFSTSGEKRELHCRVDWYEYIYETVTSRCFGIVFTSFPR